MKNDLVGRLKAAILLKLIQSGVELPTGMLESYNYHPELASSNLSLIHKLMIQSILEEEFDMDFDRMLVDMESYAVRIEDYEAAAKLRDYHKLIKEESYDKTTDAAR